MLLSVNALGHARASGLQAGNTDGLDALSGSLASTMVTIIMPHACLQPLDSWK